MSFKGDFLAGATVVLKFTTVDSTGAPTTLAGTPAVVVYKDDSVTQSSAGVTLTVDFDGVTGRNLVVIDTTQDTNFYTDGSKFDAEISVGTVGGVSVVGYPVGDFTLGAILAYDLPNRTDFLNLQAIVQALPDAAAVNAQVVDALLTDLYAEPGQGAPPATASIVTKLNYCYKFLRNRIDNDRNAGLIKVYNDAGSTIDQQATESDDGSTYTRGKFVGGS